MGFYYAKEKAQFERMWNKLRDEYKVAGMEGDVIEKLYDFDWRWFCSQRTYSSHNQRLPEAVIGDDMDEENSHLFRKYSSLYVLPEDERWRGRYGWIDTISDECLIKVMKKLSTRDIELLTLFVFEGFSQQEIAQKWGCSQQSVSWRLQKIKKLFK